MAKIPLHIKDIPTMWTKVLIGQQSQGDTAAEARNELLVHYHEAVLRYLRLELRNDENAADEIYSKFAVRLLEVDPFLKKADPQRGRFRDYLKAVLYRMVMDHYRGLKQQEKKQRGLEGHDVDDEIAETPTEENERHFLDCWKQELIDQAWRALDAVETQTGRPYATVVRIHEARPKIRSAQLAEELSERLGRTFTADGARKLVQRGRELFGDLLVREVARSLRREGETAVDAARVEEELIELGLLFSYCKAALERYAQQE